MSVIVRSPFRLATESLIARWPITYGHNSSSIFVL
jgi:hypothetical protein